MHILYYFEKWTNAALTVVCLLLTVLIGIIRYATGPEYALSLFYLFPVMLAAWKVGLKAGICVALSATLTWLMADLALITSFSHVLVPYINESFRLVVFIIITIIISKLKNSVDAQKELARTDPLTGMHNRRFFFEYAQIELWKAHRYRHALSLISIDLDNFKSVNDESGHAMGDKLLRYVAHTIMTNIRAMDIAARLGGDEFCVLLPQIGTHAALQVADKLNKKLLHVMIQNNWPVTFSIGLIAYDQVPESDTIQDIVDMADTLMYDAKKCGKNMIASCLI